MIVLKNVSNSRAIRKMIERRVNDWIRSTLFSSTHNPSIPQAGPVSGPRSDSNEAPAGARRDLTGQSAGPEPLNARPDLAAQAEQDVQYRAVLMREGEGHEVLVEVEVVEPTRRWRGRYSAPDLSRAIGLALRSMAVVQLMRPSYATAGG